MTELQPTELFLEDVENLVRGDEPRTILADSRMSIQAESVLHSTEVDEQALASLWEKGRKAWKDVPSAVDWVEAIRGNSSP